MKEQRQSLDQDEGTYDVVQNATAAAPCQAPVFCHQGRREGQATGFFFLTASFPLNSCTIEFAKFYLLL